MQEDIFKGQLYSDFGDNTNCGNWKMPHWSKTGNIINKYKGRVLFTDFFKILLGSLFGFFSIIGFGYFMVTYISLPVYMHGLWPSSPLSVGVGRTGCPVVHRNLSFL
jgi:hypothetical protein